ncbi:MAG TPA: hypothetical protein DEA96_02165 [Leptospiraceae bacterium]|nr:hypothetical protein [Spirochaetaceae bacterium]HBS03740.1 hypothetical protein [Leptospiraceae bacterium]|tara:strand:+ start:25110 stop:25664 length:555 start_codon:yes stop_codon:yes gene_type:complete
MRTKPEVHVDQAGVWYFRTNPIDNASILNYFKQNLKRDEDGLYYIENKFGERKEEGYIQGVEGFPLVISSLSTDTWKAYLECDVQVNLDPDWIGKQASTEPAYFFYKDDSTLWTLIQMDGSSQAIPARLSGPCMASLHDILEQSDAGLNLMLPDGSVPVITRDPGDFFQKIDLTPPDPSDNPVE